MAFNCGICHKQIVGEGKSTHYQKHKDSVELIFTVGKIFPNGEPSLIVQKVDNVGLFFFKIFFLSFFLSFFVVGKININLHYFSFSFRNFHVQIVIRSLYCPPIYRGILNLDMTFLLQNKPPFKLQLKSMKKKMTEKKDRKKEIILISFFDPLACNSMFKKKFFCMINLNCSFLIMSLQESIFIMAFYFVPFVGIS